MFRTTRPVSSVGTPTLLLVVSAVSIVASTQVMGLPEFDLILSSELALFSSERSRLCRMSKMSVVLADVMIDFSSRLLT